MDFENWNVALCMHVPDHKIRTNCPIRYYASSKLVIHDSSLELQCYIY